MPKYSEDVLKFWQGYVREMVDVGGKGLPSAISIKLGAKLGKLYKARGFGTNLETTLIQLYIALNAKPVVNKISDNKYEIIVKHKTKFCPIGGKCNPANAELFQKNICTPFTIGCLNELFPNLKFGSEITNCIVANDQRICRYILTIGKKEAGKTKT